MTDKFDDFKVTAPELSFEEALPSEDDIVAVPIDAEADSSADEAGKDVVEASSLSSEELAIVNTFVEKIDINNSQAIMNYGVGAQKKIADFSEKALENVKTQDMGEVGNMITGLVGELKNFDVEEKGIFGFFKRRSNDLQALKAKYSKVETNVANIKNELETRQVQLMKDSAMLDRMYEMNLSYFKELTMYIMAGKQKLEQTRSGELAELQRIAQESGLPEDAQKAKDLATLCERFEKKIYDLELTRSIAMQTGPQIRMVQASDNLMAEKIQSTIVNTIPLWKNQMVIAMGLEHSTQAAKAQHAVNEMTNELLKKNAEALHEATIASVKESERGIVDIETLKQTNQSLIATLDEVLAIQAEGKSRRQSAEAELIQIEDQLKGKLLLASKAQSGNESESEEVQ